MEDKKFLVVNSSNEIQMIITSNDKSLQIDEGLTLVEVPNTPEMEERLKDYKELIVQFDEEGHYKALYSKPPHG